MTERQGYILRVRTLARAVAHAYLDSRAEKEVQAALDRAASASEHTQLTTVTIAHRLSTI